MWEISAIASDGSIFPFAKEDKKVKDAAKVLKGDKTGVSKSIIEACRIRRSKLQRNAIETLLLAEDCTLSELYSITGVKASIVRDYCHVFFRIKTAFSSRLDILDYIENGVSEHMDDNDNSELMSFLYKRWAISLGKDFVIWRFKLKPVDYTPGTLFDSIVKEAYFYHKEKSMGKEDISVMEYIRSTKAVLDSIKASLSIKDESKEDDAYDMKKELDIIIEDSSPFDLTIEELDRDNFINNV